MIGAVPVAARLSGRKLVLRRQIITYANGVLIIYGITRIKRMIYEGIFFSKMTYEV
jgi:hypothetical protein